MSSSGTTTMARLKTNCFSPLKYRILLHGLLQEQTRNHKRVVRYKKNRSRFISRRESFAKQPTVVNYGTMYYSKERLSSSVQYFDPLSSGQKASELIHRKIAALEQARRFVLNLPCSTSYVKLDKLYSWIVEYIPYICDSDSHWYAWTMFYGREFQHDTSQEHKARCFKQMNTIDFVNRQAVSNWYTRHYVAKLKSERQNEEAKDTP